MAARRGAREALAEMAAQNARLVVGYCAKKAELRRLQEGLAAERTRWQARQHLGFRVQARPQPPLRLLMTPLPFEDVGIRPPSPASAGVSWPFQDVTSVISPRLRRSQGRRTLRRRTCPKFSCERDVWARICRLVAAYDGEWAMLRIPPTVSTQVPPHIGLPKPHEACPIGLSLTLAPPIRAC